MKNKKTTRIYTKRERRKKTALRAVAGAVIGGAAIVALLIFVMSRLYEQLNDILISYSANMEIPLSNIQTMPPAAEEEADYALETPVIAADRDEYFEYIGELELPLNGATGFAPVRVEMKEQPDADAALIKHLEPGAGFLIIGELGEWWEVSAYGDTGFIRHEFCMINLPDVIPSIRYNATNTYNSRFASSWYALPGISGEQLYSGRSYNARLGKDEYIVAVMYPMSKKICAAQRLALAEGNCIVIYEGFRPLSVQRRVADALSEISALNEDVNKGINTAPWHIGWFIATGVSNHQRGCSIDASLVQPDLAYAVSGDYKYLTHANAPYYYNMPTPIHELSNEAVAFAYPVTVGTETNVYGIAPSAGMRENNAAQNLQRYCVSAGLYPLASEWWHFDDLITRSIVPGNSVGDYILSEVYSRPPETSDGR